MCQQDLLSKIPVCQPDKERYIAADFSIEKHLDEYFSEQVANLKRTCKEEFLQEELRNIEEQKERLSKRFYIVLGGYVTEFRRDNKRKFETRYDLVVSQGKEKGLDVDFMARLAFISEMRRKMYVVQEFYGTTEVSRANSIIVHESFTVCD
jgi:hypothetical protein